MGKPEGTWNTDDLDFDADGKLVLKNPALVKAIENHMNRDGQLIITIDGNCPLGPDFPPNVMCICVANNIEGTLRTILPDYYQR